MDLYDTPSLRERFWAKVDQSGECWLWMACRHKAGYGKFSVGGTVTQAHRVAWVLTYGAIPPGLFVCHNCPGGDNKACVRPTHLFLGTNQDNIRDCVAKGMFHTAPHNGANNPNAKLTWEQVNLILSCDLSGYRLSKMFGVARDTVNRIRRGEGWTR